MSVLYQWFHIPEEESHDEGRDMAAIHIGVAHDDDFVVSKFIDI